MFQEFNPNPAGKRIGDCAVRAICAAMDIPWDKAYMELCVEGLERSDMPNADHVWGAYLKGKGFKRFSVPDSCPDCYTVREFCRENPKGTFVLALGGHVVTVKDGAWMDSWDSKDEVPAYYWKKEAE